MISVSLERTHHTFSLSFLLEEIAVNVKQTDVSQFIRPEHHFYFWLFQGHSVSVKAVQGKQLLRLTNKCEKMISRECCL